MSINTGGSTAAPQISFPAVRSGNVENVNIHDNMIENCTYGFRCGYREWDSDRKEWIWKDIDVERPGLKMRDNTLINCKQ